MAELRLSEPARAWLAAQFAAGHAPSEEAYLDQLVAADRERTERTAALHAALNEGEASGISDLGIDAIFEQARRQRDARAR